MPHLQISMLLNIGSLVVGLGAWVLAFLAISAEKDKTVHRLSFASFSACSVPFILQFAEISNRVSQGDYAAVEDTIRAIIIAACVLVVVTILLNGIALHRVSKM